MRAHYWGPVLVVVVNGNVDADAAVVLGTQLRKLQRESDLLIDLWDVTSMDPVAIDTLAGAKHRADAGGWGFAIVADPEGPCAEALAAHQGDLLKPFRSRKAARDAFQAS